MFRGINSVKIDAKGRMAVPARYRSDLCVNQSKTAHVVVTIDTEDSCLLLYPLSVWEEIEAKIEALPSFNRVTRRIKRLLIGHATEIELDSQGRILLPPLLREHASLKGQVVLIGQGKKFEVWSEDVWATQREEWLHEAASGDNVMPDEFDNISV